MILRHLIVTPSDTTAYNGMMTFEIGVCAATDPQAQTFSLVELLRLIDDTMDRMSVKAQLVTIDSTVPGEHDPDEVLEFCLALRSKSIVVIGKAASHSLPRFLPQCDYIVTSVTNEPWANTLSSEIQYTPTKGEEWIEPRIRSNNIKANKVILADPKTPPAVILNFLQRTHFSWSIRTIHQPPYLLKVI